MLLFICSSTVFIASVSHVAVTEEHVCSHAILRVHMHVHVYMMVMSGSLHLTCNMTHCHLYILYAYTQDCNVHSIPDLPTYYLQDVDIDIVGSLESIHMRSVWSVLHLHCMLLSLCVWSMTICS